MPYLGVAPNPRENREVDDISSGFNGGTTQFTLQSGGSNVSPGKDTAIIVSLGGVVQNPGTDYTIAASTITFTTAPASGLSFFGVVLAQSIDIETTADNTVTTAKIVDGAITNAKVNASAAIAGTKVAPAFGVQNITTSGTISSGNIGVAGTAPTISLTDTNANDDFEIKVDGGLFEINDATNSANRFKINSSGNIFLDTSTLTVDATNNRVGIGTTGPTCPLNINSGSGGDGTLTLLELNHGGNDTNDAAKLNFARAGSSIGSIVLEKVASNNTTDFIFNTRASNTVSESVRITGAGKVGIGTNSPDQTLHVHKASAGSVNSSSASVLTLENNTTNVLQFLNPNNTAAQLRFGDPQDDGVGYVQYDHSNNALSIGTAGPEKVRIDSSGNVGIGTSSPSAKLTCVGTLLVKENAGLTVEATTPGTTGKLTIIGVNTNSQISAISRLKSVSTDSSSGASALTFETRTTGNQMVERMRILASGDIGIGTVNPTTGLHVNGTTRVNELLVNVASGHNGSRVHIQGHTTGSHTNIRCANSAGTELFKVRNDNSTFVGALSKSSGSFFIPHPLPSLTATKTLRHSFIEGPQCDNIYRGKVTLSSGTASINLDTVSKMTEGTFVVLNRDVQCFTSNETSYTGVKGSVSGNILTITSEDNSSTDTISWMVVGERQDPTIKESTITDDDGYLLVEEDKAAE